MYAQVGMPHDYLCILCYFMCRKKIVNFNPNVSEKKIQQMIVEKINKEKIGAFNYLLVDHLYRF